MEQPFSGFVKVDDTMFRQIQGNIRDVLRATRESCSETSCSVTFDTSSPLLLHALQALVHAISAQQRPLLPPPLPPLPARRSWQ